MDGSTLAAIASGAAWQQRPSANSDSKNRQRPPRNPQLIAGAATSQSSAVMR